MSELEEKRQDIDKVIDGALYEWGSMILRDSQLTDPSRVRESLKDMLHSQGVVIRVDKELPERKWFDDWGGWSGKSGYETCYSDVMMAGGGFFVPLIEDKPEGEIKE